MYKRATITLIIITTLISCSDENNQKAEHKNNDLNNNASVKTNSEENFQGENARNSIEEKVEHLLARLTLEEKVSLVHASGKFHVNAIERVGIPEMWLSDGPHGVRHQIERDSWASAGWDNDHSTYLPHLTSVAASWDRDIAALHGDVLGSEAREREKDYILGPGVNLARLPLYGRNFEYMGEDPMLASKLVVPQIKAIQNHDVAATIKHYALNTQELNRIGVNAKPTERTLREVYLPAFEAAVKEANVLGVMGAYNQYYGTNANQSKHLILDILKGDWGFSGVLLTDWHVDINTHDAAMHGLDLEMGTDVASYDDYFFAKPLLKAIENGQIPESVLDDKVKRILRVQYTIGMYNANRKKGERNTKAHQVAARKIASHGVVLLKNNVVNNEKVLPFQKKALKNVLVLGPNANKKHGTGGGSSEVKSLYEITPFEGLKMALGDNVNVELMRVKSSVLTPIASEYIESRHWTGTPAWNISYFTDVHRQEKIKESWIVDAAYKSADDNDESHVTMNAKLKPLASGLHTFKVINHGKVLIKIDNKVVFNHQGAVTSPLSFSMPLKENQPYDIEVIYDGKHGFTLGWDAPGNLFTTEKEYIAAAKSADAVIYFGGLSHADDRESIDRPNMVLPNRQDDVIKKLLAVNPKTVVFIVAGSAVEMPWVEQVNALVWGWYGGMEAGNAFADVLFGNVNPSGKLPITLPKSLNDTAPIALNDYNETESLYKEGVFIGYRWFESKNIEPLFSFGYGLSYSQFTLSNIELSKTSISMGEGLTVKVDVTNNSMITGSEVVQLYLHDKQASVIRPYKELKNFAKVTLAPKETQTVSLELNQRDLSFWSEAQDSWFAEKGEFTVLVGNSADNIALEENFDLK